LLNSPHQILTLWRGLITALWGFNALFAFKLNLWTGKAHDTPTLVKQNSLIDVCSLVLNGVRPYAECRGFFLAGLDHLHLNGTCCQYVADVAISASSLGTPSGTAIVDRSKSMGLMHFCDLVVVLFLNSSGRVPHGKQSNR